VVLFFGISGGEEGVCEAGSGGDGGVEGDDGAVGEAGAFAEGGWCCCWISERGFGEGTGNGVDGLAAEMVVVRMDMARRVTMGEGVGSILLVGFYSTRFECAAAVFPRNTLPLELLDTRRLRSTKAVNISILVLGRVLVRIASTLTLYVKYPPR